MKKNVYDQVRIFYEEVTVWDTVIKQEWVEGFLRQKAWQGISDDKLKDLWYQIQMFISYLSYANNDDLDEITFHEYSLSIEWLAGHISDFKSTLKSVRHFFNVLVDFYTYLFNKKIIVNIDDIKQAAKEIAGGKKLKLIESEFSIDELILSEGDIDNLATFNGEISRDFGQVIAKAVEGLMFSIGKYFHRKEFTEDFERALYLYTGPFDDVGEDGENDFWLGFWDYFLFDYHLLENDLKPLEHFNNVFAERINADEKRILQDLLNSTFTVFYIDKILSHDLVECVNLFTGEKFELPAPDFDYKSLKKLLFFGHIFSQGLVMINYLTSIEMSVNLRRRIKEEVTRQKEIFIIQEPKTTIEGFFKRHALVVRHTIDILVTLTRVNVTSMVQVERSYPRIEATRIPDQKVIKLLYELVVKYGFSFHDKILLEKMWFDFCQLHIVNVRKPGIWAAAVLCAYIQINSVNKIAKDELATHFDISTASISKNYNKVHDILQLQVFDARYLSEEGFVNSLFVQ